MGFIKMSYYLSNNMNRGSPPFFYLFKTIRHIYVCIIVLNKLKNGALKLKTIILNLKL